MINKGIAGNVLFNAFVLFKVDTRLAQVGCDFIFLGDDVVLFPRVILIVEKPFFTAIVPVYKFVGAVGCGHIAFCALGMVKGDGAVGVCGGDVAQAFSDEGMVIGNGDLRGFEYGCRDIPGGDGCVAGSVCDAWATGNHGDVGRAFIGEMFLVAFAITEHFAMIGHEDDEGVVYLAGFFECVEYAANVGVYECDGGKVGFSKALVGQTLDVFGCGGGL